MKEQRRSPRYRHELIVEVHDKRGARRLHAIDVARHGIFIVTDDPPRERHLVQLTMQLPNGVIRAAATVTRVIPKNGGAKEPGAGLQFFALSDDDKERWDEFIFYLHRSTPARGVEMPSTPPGASDAPQTFEPSSGGGGGATFLVKLKTAERLADFATSHLASGGTVLFTPVMRAPGESVTLVVVHPKSDEEFKLPGIIARCHTDRPKRMEIHFSNVNAQLMNAFRAFVESGRPPPLDQQQGNASTQAPSVIPQPSSSPLLSDAVDFDLDVDVFNEETLDTDDRLGQMPNPLTSEADFIDLPGFASPPAAATPPPAALRAPDPGLKPSTYLIRCSSCDTEPYAIDLGPCRGVLGLVADHQALLSHASGKVVSVPRLVGTHERTHRVQTFVQQGGQLQAPVDLMTMLSAVTLSEDALDPEDEEPLKSSRAVERLDAAARRLESGTEAAHTKVKCHACKDGNVTIEHVKI